MNHNPYKYKITVAYDGTNYCGWQIQPNGNTIQAELHQALKTILRHETTLIGSGRTDAGVHAIGQVAHFTSEKELPLRRTLESINGILPRDIRVNTFEEASPSFHAQYSAVGKIYHYHITLARYQSPFTRLYSYHLYDSIDLDQLTLASQAFPGTHDFTAFANEAHAGSASRDAVRTLKRLDVVLEEGGLRLEFEADGFLYKMVRNITGTLLDVASSKRDIEEIPYLLTCKDRREAGRAVPPHGLFLMQVLYEPN